MYWYILTHILFSVTRNALNLLLEKFSTAGVSVILLTLDDLVKKKSIRWQLQHVSGFVVMTSDQYQVQYVLKQVNYKKYILIVNL